MTLAQLSPAARHAVESRAIHGAWDVRSLLQLLTELERWDHAAAGAVAKARILFAWGVGSVIVGFILFLLLIGAGLFAFFAGLLVLGASVVFLLRTIRVWRAARRMDLPDEPRLLLKPVIRQLAQDLHPSEKIRVSINLAVIDEKKPGRSSSGPAGGNRHWKQRTYDEDVCSLRLPLIDGCAAILRLENSYLRTEKSYKSRSGKSKCKTKWKKQSTVTTMLIPPAHINWEPARMQQHIDRVNEKVSFVEKDGVMAARLDRYYKFKSVDGHPKDVPPPADVLKMFIRLMAMQPSSNGPAR